VFCSDVSCRLSLAPHGFHDDLKHCRVQPQNASVVHLPPRCTPHGERASNGASDIVGLLCCINQQTEIAYATKQVQLSRSGAQHWVYHALETDRLAPGWHLLLSQIAALQGAVTEFDGHIVGYEATPLPELRLRAQTLAILLSLDELCDAVRRGSLGRRDLSIGRFQAIDDAVWFVIDELAAVNQLWLRYRICLSELKPHSSTMERSMHYHAGIHRAQCALVALWADPDLSRVLQAGTCAAASQVRNACVRIVEILKMTSARELCPVLFNVYEEWWRRVRSES
jgi:hypothetical protein